MKLGAGIRVMVVEDSDLLRATVSDALRLRGFDVVLEARTVLAAIQGAEATHPDCAVLDVSLGAGPTGIDLAHALRQRDPEIGLVFLTSYEDPRLLGANIRPLPRSSGYLVKQSMRDIESLAMAVTEAVAAARGDVRAKPAKPGRMGFTDHQMEIWRLVASGMTNAEIAAELDITTKAVEQSITRIARRLGINDSSQGNLRVLVTREFVKVSRP